MSKNIVVFSDGTGQEGGKGFNTNVYRLFNMIEDRTDRQVAFYDRGLGTGFRKLSGNAFGLGISKNIQDCYQFIFENYKVGDKIYLFGFSRGAFTVRSLSGFLHHFGILPKSRPELIKRAYKIYKMKDECQKACEAKKFVKKHHNMWCEIEFLGVWDTVGALGIPLRAFDLVNWGRNTFHDTTLSENIQWGRHALAIDDRRKTFHPMVWDETHEQTAKRVKQVWFAGMHTDVGGGYQCRDLSDISLKWMLDEARAKNLHIYADHEIELNPKPTGFMHDSKKGILGKLFRTKERGPEPKLKKLIVHKSVIQRHEAGMGYDPWILNGDYDVD